MRWQATTMMSWRSSEDPEFVLQGTGGTLIAGHAYGRQRYLMVVYKELRADDGFIVTAYFTSKLDRSRLIWRTQ